MNGRPPARAGTKGRSGSKPAAAGGARAHRRKGGPLRWLARMGRPQVAVLCGATMVLLIVVLLFACLAPGGVQAASGSWYESWPEESLAPPLSGIDLDADSLPPPEAYVDTILPETEDAGMSYLKETLFLGDSNTQRMLYYSDISGTSLDNCVGVVGMGIHSFETLRCVQFQGSKSMVTMVEAAEVIQPRRIVITFGSNNLGMATNNFIAYYKSAIEALQKACPDTDIILGAVFPVDRYCENQSITVEMVDRFNAALAALADAEDCKFLNWHEALRDGKTGYCQKDYTIIDGIHLSRAGMESIFEYMRTHSYITEDTRPQRKGAVPKIAGTMPSVIKADPYKPDGPYSRSSSASSEDSSMDSSSLVASSSSVSASSLPSSSSASVPAGTSVPAATTSVPAATTSVAATSSVAPPTSQAQTVTVTCVVDPPGAGTAVFSTGMTSITANLNDPCPAPTVTAANGYTFVGWKNNIAPGHTLTGNVTLTALFAVSTPATDTTVTGQGG